mmetsp:Transcript_18420/g.26778  ORF Transcript_18420/g.26778 Transcript_18420/m.26778 type:complete len:341 (-) Transcript_18420:333-1355(-)
MIIQTPGDPVHCGHFMYKTHAAYPLSFYLDFRLLHRFQQINISCRGQNLVRVFSFFTRNKSWKWWRTRKLWPFDCITHPDKSTFVARHATMDEQEVSSWLNLHYLEVGGGHPVVPHFAVHLLALEHPAWVLALSGGSQGAVGLGAPVASRAPFEPVLLHGPLGALALRDATNIDQLPCHKVLSMNLCTHGDEGLGSDPELPQLPPGGVQLVAGVVALQGPLGVLGFPHCQLQGVIAIVILSLDLDHRTVVHLEDGARVAHPPLVPHGQHAHLHGQEPRSGPGPPPDLVGQGGGLLGPLGRLVLRGEPLGPPQRLRDVPFGPEACGRRKVCATSARKRRLI